MNRLQRIRLGAPSSFSIIIAATNEAYLAGAREITPDHLLAALVVSGGPAAELLASHGVTLARLREAIISHEQADLAGLGVDVSALPRRRRRTLAELAASHDTKEFSPLAEQLIKPLASARGEIAMLRTLVGHPTAGASEVLEACGVDLASLRAELAVAPEAVPKRHRRVAPVAGLLDDLPEATVAVTRFLPVELERLLPAVREPESVVQWLFRGDERWGVAGEALLTSSREKRGRTRHEELRRVIDEQFDGGAEIAWQLFAMDEEDPRSMYLHLRLEQVGVGTRLTLTRGIRGFGPLAPLGRRLAVRLQPLGTSAMLHGIVLIAEGDA